jgi:phasin family protein
METNMYMTPEKIAATNKTNLESLIGLAAAQFAALERLSTLNFKTGKSAFEDGAAYARSALSAKDAQELAKLSTAAGQPALEKAIAYSRSVYEIAMQARAEMTRFAEAHATEFNKRMLVYLDTVAKEAPSGSDVAIAAVKSALAAASSTYESISRATSHASEFAETNFTTAATVLKSAKKKAA